MNERGGGVTKVYRIVVITSKIAFSPVKICIGRLFSDNIIEQ